MKEPVTVYFRHKANGEVVGEIRDKEGVVVASRSFGLMDEEEYKRCLKHIERTFPEAVCGPLIEIDVN